MAFDSRRFLLLLLALVLGGCADHPGTPTNGSLSLSDSVAVTGPTFAKDIAPIIYSKCYRCHRDGELAPFPFKTLEDVRVHGSQIVEVTRSRYMPPWKPSPGYVSFRGEHETRLSDEELRLIEDWVVQGMAPGDLASCPPVPDLTVGWHMGEPDLVTELKEPYSLYAEGPDVYRLFVLDLPVDRPRYVKAVEFRPGNYRVAHHAFMLIDKTGRSRRLDAEDPVIGFDKMDGVSESAQRPDGILLGWQVGRLPTPPQDGIRWRLDPGDDMVIELHMQASGKPEEVQPSIGLYFTDDPPTKYPVIVSMYSQEIDIPPGVSDYSFRNEYTLPMDVKATSVLAHAHYLGKRMHAWATLPSGERKWLIRIDDWDFAWQSDYFYEEPFLLPKGTVITQHFTYDNSAENPRNPFSPPRRVRYGVQTADEMGELHLQVLCPNQEAADQLERDNRRWRLEQYGKHWEIVLAKSPDDAEAHLNLAKVHMGFNRFEEGGEHIRKSVELDGRNPEARFYLGYYYLLTRQPALAETAFRQTLELDPEHYQAHSSLGKIHLEGGNVEVAIRDFKEALRLNPHDPFAHSGLATALTKLKKYAEALEHFDAAVRLRPEMSGAKKSAEQIRSFLASQGGS